MDSGNSGSMSSSGDEEYDSQADQTVLPATCLNHPAQFGLQSSLVSSHHQSHHSSLFDLSSSYLHALSQSQPNSNPNSFLNLDAGPSHGRRSEANCTDPASLPGVSSSSAAEGINQCLLAPQALGQCATDPSLQLLSVHDDNARVLSAAPTNAIRNSKKRTRASRRAPTTVLTTDTANFRSMVQEFTGIPAPPFSGSSYSRRLDLLTGSSSLRSAASRLDLETTGALYPLRPSAQRVQPNRLLLSSSSPSPSTLLHNNMVDAIASTTNISSSATTNHSSSNNSINYQLPPDLSLPYHLPQNIMLSMQNHPILGFQPPPPLHPLGNTLPAGFNAKSQTSLSMSSLEDLGVSHGQVNAHLVVGGVSVPPGHDHLTSEDMTLGSANDDGCRDGSTKGGLSGGGRRDPHLDGSYGKVPSVGSCKLNFSASASSSLNREKTLENTSTRGEGTVDSWICSSD